MATIYHITRIQARVYSVTIYINLPSAAATQGTIHIDIPQSLPGGDYTDHSNAGVKISDQSFYSQSIFKPNYVPLKWIDILNNKGKVLIISKKSTNATFDFVRFEEILTPTNKPLLIKSKKVKSMTIHYPSGATKKLTKFLIGGKNYIFN